MDNIKNIPKSPVLTPMVFANVIGVIILVNIIAHMHRIAPAVITPEIMQDLSLEPSTMALITGSSMAAAMLFQVPSGLMFDRFGVTKTVPVLMLFGAMGAAVFAVASSATQLAVGRALSGFGCGSLIMGSLVLCFTILPKSQFAFVSGIVLSLGQLGNILVSLPLAQLSEIIGWQNAFYCLSFITLLAAILYFITMKISDIPLINSEEKIKDAIKTTSRIFCDRRLWPIFVMAFTGYSTHFALMALWYGLFLDELGLDLLRRGQILLFVNIAFALGLFVFGRAVSIFPNVKSVVLSGSCFTVILLFILTVTPWPSSLTATLIFVLIGFSGGFTVSIIAHGASFYQTDEFGRGVTAMNTLVLGGATITPVWTGYVFQHFQNIISTNNQLCFRILFFFLTIWLSLGILFYLKSETKNSNE